MQEKIVKNLLCAVQVVGARAGLHITADGGAPFAALSAVQSARARELFKDVLPMPTVAHIHLIWTCE